MDRLQHDPQQSLIMHALVHAPTAITDYACPCTRVCEISSSIYIYIHVFPGQGGKGGGKLNNMQRSKHPKHPITTSREIHVAGLQHTPTLLGRKHMHTNDY